MTLLLTVVYFISNSTLPDSVTVTQDLINLVILAITIVVVAVPEGLPLAVTLSLAHATVQMLKDNNLVRNLASCETMGNATTICSDKTGTLTLNKMTVVQGIVAAEQFSQDANKTPSNLKNTVDADLLKFTCSSLNINSTAAESRTKEGEIIMEGSKTEIALLHFTESLGFKYVSDREQSTILDLFPFSSETKRMSCKIELNISESLATKLNIKLSSTSTTQVLFVKGASEVVLKDCTFGVDNEGNIIPITQALRSSYENLITKYAKDALRTIAAAYSSENSNDLVLLGIFGIQDPLRDEVPLAVANCQSAGVVVRMVTGDSAPTARAIARGCGILTADGLVMEGPEFRKLSETEMNSIIPRLQVLARSSPLDKQILVQNLKRLGETVAVTGGNT
ncbi:Calcium-transporting ATPase 10, plasma membrane-type [Globomyces sp. JEL0801]|nr:Calcium-transporting ATPase 10, plasma membrane-type [Globomyces sp. JEL0801]